MEEVRLAARDSEEAAFPEDAVGGECGGAGGVAAAAGRRLL